MRSDCLILEPEKIIIIIKKKKKKKKTRKFRLNDALGALGKITKYGISYCALASL